MILVQADPSLRRTEQRQKAQSQCQRSLGLSFLALPGMPLTL